MPTAREQAREVAQKILAHDAEWWLPNLIDEASEQVSDVWEPIVRELYEALLFETDGFPDDEIGMIAHEAMQTAKKALGVKADTAQGTLWDEG